MTTTRRRAGAWRRLQELDLWAAQQAFKGGRVAIGLHELVCFGVKQASACLFGGLMVALLLVSWRWYPPGAVLSRYDFLSVSAVTIQASLLAAGLESRDEAKVIALFHVVGTVMELFKTAVGSWVYPGPSLLHVGGVPLFTGFMYAAVGSYIARAWRLFDFRFTRHPPFGATAVLAVAIYVNFFSHHVLPDTRWLLFAALAWLFGPTWVHFRIRRVHRRMPLLLGFVLVALFIWLAENVGTFSHAWLYPAQRAGWHWVPLAKLGSWLLLMVISYVMVSAVHRRGPGGAGVSRDGVVSGPGAARRWLQPRVGATIPGLVRPQPTEATNVPEGLHDRRL